MKSKLLLLSGMTMLAAGANAQQLQADYIEWPQSSKLAEYVSKWKAGEQLFEDENFFISRVALKPYIRNTATQVYPEFNESNDKRLCFWVPVGDAEKKGVHTDALPNGMFDSEVFSMWPYVTHYGDWISPHGWVPAGFADAAHRHGTLVTGVASIPYGSINSEWSAGMTAQSNLDNEHLAHFLYYHGVNGLGYNSEFGGGSSFIKKIQLQHEAIVKYFKEKGVGCEIPWYDGVNNNGSLSFSERLAIGSNDENFGSAGHERANLFVNYNWSHADRIETTRQACETLGRNMLDLYAGHNMQGSGSSDNAPYCFPMLATCNYSIGLWGAHQNNMLWQGRNTQGSSPQALQNTYQKRIEQFFSNGARNPIAKQPITNTAIWGPADDWYGMSRFMSARSSLGWDLAAEPFVTYFNLGNGLFYNWKGERQNDKDWYNLGIQDYMPTWRFWFADKFLGKNPENMPKNGLDANFVWSDAWMGGSCLNITGSTADEYLHLFKTQFELQARDEITIRYKLLNGSANLSLALSVDGAETTVLREDKFQVFDAEQESDDVWVEKTFTINGPLTSAFQGKNLAVVGLHFTNAENISLLLGEFSIKRGSYSTPVKPEVTLSKVLANNYSGVDGKIIFKMASNKDVNEPVYNLDVNTSLFRVWAQQEGEEPVNMGATSSWAAIVFSAPINRDGKSSIRFGVSAVSTDYANESEIAWGEYMPLGDYVMNTEFEISKSVIKPNEPFSIYYVDPAHPVVDWTIYDINGKKVAEQNSSIRIDVAGLENVGGYDLVINEGKADEQRLNFYVQVSPFSVGAVPEIHSIAVNGEEDPTGVSIKPAQKVELSYTGREADGHGSRGVSLNEKLLGVKVGDLGLEAYKSFSVAAWVRLGKLDAGTYSFMTIENRNGSWPFNNWGFFWNRIDQDGYIDNALIDGAVGAHLDSDSEGMRLFADYSDSRITPEAWVHVAYVFEYNETHALRYSIYINGVKQNIKRWLHIHKGTREGNVHGDWRDFSASGATAYGDNTTETGYASSNYPLTAQDWISFGGTSQNIIAMKATIDDLQVWNKAMSDDDVKTAMNGFNEQSVPEGVLGWWDFNTDPDAELGFASKGANKTAKAYRYEHRKMDGEGEAKHTPIIPEYSAGSPFLESDCYAVVTTPTWTMKRGTVESTEGKDTEGKAVVSFSREGNYAATLTLENSHGSDSRDYPVLTVAGSNSIVDVEALENVEVYAADGTLFVGFAEAGTYTVEVYSLNGSKINGRTMTVEAGSAAQLTIANPNVYIVKVTGEGKTVRNVKVVVR